MLVGVACRGAKQDKQASVVIARSETTGTALPGPTVLADDGPSTVAGSPGRGAAPSGRGFPIGLDALPAVGVSGGLLGLPSPATPPPGATTGTDGARPGQTPTDTGSGSGSGSGGNSSPLAPTAPSSPTQDGRPPLARPDGAPYGSALPFSPSVPVPDSLVFVLAIGSDARPGTDPRRGNADSLHLLAVDPATGSGTVLGFPRDAWVEIPGRGKNKINAALRLGGPQLQAETIRLLTGLPVHFTVLTGFDGFQRLVDDVGGVNVNVPRNMDDADSGARFEAGWHHMTGAEALAYSRNRKDTPNGDFSRSEAQGQVMLSALAKLRAEVSDDGGLGKWIDVLVRHADLDSPPWDLRQLATLARTLDPARLTNKVVSGRPGTANNQFVIFLGTEATRIFVDLRADAVIGGA